MDRNYCYHNLNKEKKARENLNKNCNEIAWQDLNNPIAGHSLKNTEYWNADLIN